MSRIKFCRCCKYNYKSSKEQIFYVFLMKGRFFLTKKCKADKKNAQIDKTKLQGINASK